MEQVTQSGDNDAVHVDQSTKKRAARDNVALESIIGPTNGADVYVDDLTFFAGKSPLQGSHDADEKKASGAGGLAQGTPEFSTDELVKELSKQIEYFKNQHQQDHKDRIEQQFLIVELVKELAKQIGNLQPHQQEYKVKVKQQSGRSADMFCDDMFGESPAGIRKMVSVLEVSSDWIMYCLNSIDSMSPSALLSSPWENPGEQDKGDGLLIECSYLHDNWDDPEGYYRYRFREILDGLYEILAAHGKGIFSTVVRAKDLKARPGDPEEVAITIIPNNETMYKAGMEELIILKKLVAADPNDKRHCKKLGRDIGLSLGGVRFYAEQLFSALKHLKNYSVLHCDFKPDNILVNEARTVLKLCDFGNAMFAGKNEITPYLVSRFYRAPEISEDMRADLTGDANQKGDAKRDKSLASKGAFTYQHFDQDLKFLVTEEDPITKKAIRKLIVNIKPKDISSVISGQRDGLPIERSYLHDYSCDDPKGYHFGEILDGRYEILAAHGKDVFSTVVWAKNLKARHGDPEDGAFTYQNFDQELNFLATEEDPIRKKVRLVETLIARLVIP
ncbi:hypothetical protein KY285_025506 [Solanum tuberosum]|nr:hypothetical protein KY285_025506 [Solanum tuberosum]